MKYAFKPQSMNPNILPGVNPNSIWLKITIKDEQQEEFEGQGYTVSDTDNFMVTHLTTRRYVPNQITPRQARQALILSGISSQMVVDAIETLEEPYKSLAMTEWEYSTAFIRTNPLVASIGSILGWTSEQLDQLWITGSKL